MTAPLPLVVVPGILEDEASWAGALEGLGLPVQVLANQGGDVAAMAASLLDRAPPRFILLGHSLGGYVALQAVLASPERVAGLALITTSARAETEVARLARADLIASGQTDFPGVVSRLARAALAPAHRAALTLQVEAMMLAGGFERFMREQLAAATRPAPAARLAEITCPVLVMAGGQDAVIDPVASDELAAGIAQARLERIEGSGHMPHLEARAAFRAALADWLQGLAVKASNSA
jgi:pimeloyl-ACP methyl ester carboxylesterase